MCGGELAYLWITSPKTQWHMCETVILSGDGALVQGFSYSHRARGLPNPPSSDARFDGCLCDGITLSKSRKAHTSRESGTKSPLSSSKDLSPEHSTHTSIICCSTLYSPPENSTALNFWSGLIGNTLICCNFENCQICTFYVQICWAERAIVLFKKRNVFLHVYISFDLLSWERTSYIKPLLLKVKRYHSTSTSPLCKWLFGIDIINWVSNNQRDQFDFTASLSLV